MYIPSLLHPLRKYIWVHKYFIHPSVLWNLYLEAVMQIDWQASNIFDMIYQFVLIFFEALSLLIMVAARV